MNRTPGTISALPSSLHSATFWSIWSRTSDLISPVSPLNRAKNPYERLLMTSISWRETVCTTSFLFSISPSGHYTNLVVGPIASKSLALVNDRPNLLIRPETLSIVMTSPLDILSLVMASIILLPKSYTVSISVVLRVIFPVLLPVAWFKFFLITCAFVYLYLDDFSFDDFGLLLDSDSYWPPECLCEGFSLGHLEGEYLRSSHSSEWNIRT